jgi:haloalkane dehalogenase
MPPSDITRAFQRHQQLPDGAQVYESGNGPEVLLLHGNPDSHTVWYRVVERLAATHRCIAPDLPGFGGTPLPASATFTLEEQGGFVRGVVDALGVKRVHLVVHDVGGAYGLAFAAMHPERLHSLTIMNTGFFPGFRWHFWARVWRTPVLGELVMKATPRALFVRSLKQGSPRMPTEYAEHAFDAFDATTKAGVLRWYRAMDPKQWTGWDDKLFAAVKHVPRQVLWGDRDPFLPRSFADRFGGANGGDVKHFADAGHWVMLEEPAAVADAIDGLVERAAKAS